MSHRAIKRMLDIGLSGTGLILSSPLWPIIATAIKVDSRGPIFYGQKRVGRDGRVFTMWKFRSMRTDAEAATGPVWARVNDTRVTPIGRFLRRTRLDEIPQLWNVLRGEMSLVGPRPLPLRDHAMLEDWHKARYLVLPGMTGLWQISGRSGLDFDDLVRLDFTYIESWSIWSDVSIIARTIPAVLGGRGAY